MFSIIAACALWLPLQGTASEAVNAVIEQATAWIAADQALEVDRIAVRKPDQRARITVCSQPIQFRWPFERNTRTVEATCSDPNWRYFLRVDMDSGVLTVVPTRDLDEGHLLKHEDLQVTRQFEHIDNAFTEIDSVVGFTLNTAIEANTPIQRSFVTQPSIQFITTKSYGVGEQLQLDDLYTTSVTQAKKSDLTVWPPAPVISTRPLSAGATLSETDVVTGQRIVVANVNILRNQVITDDMVATVLRSPLKIRGKPVADIRQAIGFEAVRTLKIGTPILASDLREAELVREGESVTLTITRGSLSITVDTIAVEDAKLGEQVLLRNTESGREIRGIVTGRNSARGL